MTATCLLLSALALVHQSINTRSGFPVVLLDPTEITIDGINDSQLIVTVCGQMYRTERSQTLSIWIFAVAFAEPGAKSPEFVVTSPAILRCVPPPAGHSCAFAPASLALRWTFVLPLGCCRSLTTGCGA